MARHLSMLLVAAGFGVIFSSAKAAGPADAACKALASADFSSVRDAPARVMDADFVERAAEVPRHCHVQGYVWPQVGFELRLPVSNWNAKFIQIGIGGSGGTTRVEGLIRQCREMLRRGYACLLEDRGHTASKTGGGNVGRDYLWAYNNLQAEIDFGFRAAHVAALAGKAITKRYYSSAPKFSYMMGCSGGGRQGLIAAQRFPWDFDGIVAIDSSQNGLMAKLTAEWNARVSVDDRGQPLFTPADTDLLHNAAIARCDLDDGVEDGVIGYPPACPFDPAELLCRRGKRSGCLSQEQITAAQKIYDGARASSGERIFYGTLRGAEKNPFGFLTSDSKRLTAGEWSAYIAFMPDPGPGWHDRNFDFDTDYKRLGMTEAIISADNPDLRRFKAAGGKLIITHGWDDSGLPLPLGTVDYYETMERTMGGREATQEFARLFMMPGRAHCGGGPGANAFDYLAYLEAWVEEGKSPDVMIGAHVESDNAADFIRLPADMGNANFTRPVYPYPLRAKYRGEGDVDDYRNFVPVPPAPQ